MKLDPVNAIKEFLGFIRLIFSRFFFNLGPQNAAALTYSTLLSLVPLLTVTFVILSAFPVADRMADVVQDFIFNNFVPASGEIVQQSLEEFVGKASRLTGPSFIVLFLVAMLMMNNIDSALNRIWGTSRARGTVRKFLVYWALLTLGPLLVIVSLGMTSYLISLPLVVEAEQRFHFMGFIVSFLPILISAMAFTMMYVTIPNRRVNFGNALAGGMIAALLFELAKRGFGYYVTNFPSYEAIYGAFAALPIFLVWIYLSWMIFLLGAEFAHSLEIYRYRDTLSCTESSDLDRALGTLSTLHRAHKSGNALKLGQISDELRMPPVEVEALLADLQKRSVVLRTDAGQWALAKNLESVNLYDLYSWLDIPLPKRSEITGPWQDQLNRKLAEADASIAEVFALPLDELVKEVSVEQKKTDAS